MKSHNDMGLCSYASISDDVRFPCRGHVIVALIVTAPTVKRKYYINPVKCTRLIAGWFQYGKSACLRVFFLLSLLVSRVQCMRGY